MVLASQPGQVEELSLFGRRRSSVRRSARSAHVKGPIDPKGKRTRSIALVIDTGINAFCGCLNVLDVFLVSCLSYVDDS